MALIRGGMGLFPCPVCLVPKDQLSEYSLKFTPRTGKDAQDVFNTAMSQKLIKDREALLQSCSLRPVQV